MCIAAIAIIIVVIRVIPGPWYRGPWYTLKQQSLQRKPAWEWVYCVHTELQMAFIIHPFSDKPFLSHSHVRPPKSCWNVSFGYAGALLSWLNLMQSADKVLSKHNWDQLLDMFITTSFAIHVATLPLGTMAWGLQEGYVAFITQAIFVPLFQGGGVVLCK